LDNARVVEVRNTADNLSMMQQLGIVSMPGAACYKQGAFLVDRISGVMNSNRRSTMKGFSGEQSSVIQVPAAEVYNYLSDFPRHVEWNYALNTMTRGFFPVSWVGTH
jgi:hypothetical protein